MTKLSRKDNIDKNYRSSIKDLRKFYIEKQQNTDAGTTLWKDSMTKYTSLPSSPHAIRASPLEADVGSFKRLKERVVDVLMLPVMAIGTAL